MDLFEHKGQQYLLVADYFSHYPVVRRLQTITSKAVIEVLRTVFSEHGVPAKMVTDQGRQFYSEEFKQFAKDWHITMEYSSPRYPRANGFAEAMVKVTKGLIVRAEAAGTDPHLALMAYRATPIRTGQRSPAELLTGRKLRVLIPVRTHTPVHAQESREEQLRAKKSVAEYHDQRARALQELLQFQDVRVQLNPDKPIWQKGVVVDTPGPGALNSYRVQTEDGGIYQRNRTFIKPAMAATESRQIPVGAAPSGSSGVSTETKSSNTTSPPLLRRSTRVSRPPKLYAKEYQG
jgi:hypothetical protein